ncbi:beta-1,2-xylosyltransferase XYXT1-like isoform X1 [Miscanthus floridulus]|uniref:beta-1,2-xylosyltransferase XYXT1-like isoform X1 n=2 Tax=Miscanthus floridulus TaxID=154761 RepID=UPI00345A3B71
MKKTMNKLWPALAESKLAIALFAGLFVAAVTFLSVRTQFAVRGTNALLRGSSGDGGAGLPAPGEETSDHARPPLGEEIAPATATATSVAQVHPPLEPICDLSDRRYDGCEMWGDARTASGVNKSVVYFIPPPQQLATAAAATWSIRSQSRKIVGVREVIVRSLDASSLHEAPHCTVRRAVPAVVFALGGLTSNYWHAFSDVLVPLFTTARSFGGDVELLATGAGGQAWFIGKYDRVLRALSRYDVVDLDADGDVVRCYRHLVVGLRGHRDFDIDPARAPNGYDMLAFREFVRAGYSLPPPPPPPAATLPCKSGTKPRLMLILRGRTRRFVNEGAIMDAIERAGFEVACMNEAASWADVGAVAREVDACDVLVGAHGAGLTNMVFLRAGAVVVQVIPWGKMEPYGEGFFGAPAAHMGLRHVAYIIAAEESTLYDKYGKDHPVIADPDVFYRNGSNAKFYWREQNIRLNTTRFAPTLQMVKRMLRE